MVVSIRHSFGNRTAYAKEARHEVELLLSSEQPNRLCEIIVSQSNPHDDASTVANKILELASAIRDVSDEVHPPMSKKEFAAKQRKWRRERNGQTASEEAMRQIDKHRRNDKIQAEQERQGGL